MAGYSHGMHRHWTLAGLSGLFAGTTIIAGVVAPVLIETCAPHRPKFVVDRQLITLVVQFAISQGGLLGLWAALSGRPSPWRIFETVVLTFVALCVCPYYLGLFIPLHNAFRPTAFLVLEQIVPVGLVGLIVRLIGVTLADDYRNAPSALAKSLSPPARVPLESSDGIGADVPDAGRPRLQFSLWAVLEWTTALGIFLSACCTGFFPDILYSEMIVASAINAVAVTIAAWAVLGVKWPILRTFAVLALLAVEMIFFVIGLRGDVTTRTVLAFALPISGVAMWLLGFWWAFRIAGYRLVWRGRGLL